MIRLLGFLARRLGRLRSTLHSALAEERLARLRAAGMRLGQDVYLPESTWIDERGAHLISIGDGCGFGPQVMLLTGDPAASAARGAHAPRTITIHESCHIGSRAVLLPGVEIGPRTIVGSSAVVVDDLPPDTVCVGNPARPVTSLSAYLAKHLERAGRAPRFPYDTYDIRALTPERRAELIEATARGDAYITGGRSAELQGRGGSRRTAATDDP